MDQAKLATLQKAASQMASDANLWAIRAAKLTERAKAYHLQAASCGHLENDDELPEQ